MDKCFNCGAAVRPGAKFCTSCGTRLIDNPAATTSVKPEETSWSQAASTGETQVAAPVAEHESPSTTGSGPDDSHPFSTWRHANSTWQPDQSGETSAGASPADRFEAALDATGEQRERSSTADDRFASWSAAYGTSGQADASTSADIGNDNEAEAASVERATITATTDEVSERDTAETDNSEGEKTIAGEQDAFTSSDRPSDDSDVRQRATALIEELRELVWKIGEQEPVAAGDMTEVRNTLSAARGNTADFSDLERVIATVRQSPRDIDALVQLGGHARRLEELLESHARLTSVLDDAISKMR